MKATTIEAPYCIYPNFLITHQARGTYRPTVQYISFPEAWSYAPLFLHDAENVSLSQRRKKRFRERMLLTVGGASVLLLAIGTVISDNKNAASSSATSPTSSTIIPETVLSIAEKNGMSLSDVEGEFSIINRYQLDSYTEGIITGDANDIYQLESSDTYGAGLKVAGVGSLGNITDTLAHIVKAWNVNDADVDYSISAIFDGLTQSSISWSDYSNVLIVNGPKMSAYVSLSDAAIDLAGLQTGFDTQDALNIFNAMGNELAEPNSQLNLAMGGPGYIRTLVKQEGFMNATQTVSKFIQANTSTQ